jgi:DNA-binding FadR family transcriptional regulator
VALTDNAIDKIKAMIVSGEFPSGSKLPKEEDLAQMLGLSRSSLREAVRALTAMRILVTKQGDGTYVSSLEPHLLMETLSFISEVAQNSSAGQLMQVRRLLEPQAVALAAGHLTGADLTRLGEVLTLSEATISVDEFVRLDIEFHKLIVDVLGNPVLSLLLQAMSTKTQRVRIVRGNVAHQAVENARREHRAILAALTDRDAQLAASLSTAHVYGVEQWLEKSSLDG